MSYKIDEKYRNHCLSDEKSPKYCPLQTGVIQCDSFCAWFDHENQDCRHLGILWKITEAIRDHD